MDKKEPPISQALTAHHLALKVKDLDRCEDFYSRILGLPVVDRHNDEKGHARSVWLQVGSMVLMLEKGEEFPEEASKSQLGWHLLALEIPVAERDAWKNRLVRDVGVSITHETDYSFYFLDPEGNRVALTHYPRKK